MSVTLLTSVTAMAVGRSTSTIGINGTAPYVYSVLPNGAGGVIDAATGIYTAPLTVNLDPTKQIDTIVVTDADMNTAQATISVMTPLMLVCDILATELELDPTRVRIYNQKIFQPEDSGLFIAVQVRQAKPFANNMSFDSSGAGLVGVQSVNTIAVLEINVISRDMSALNRKEEVLMALNSIYSETQQELNAFMIGNLPPGGQFLNLSGIDGAAIPYRFNISVNMQYFVTKVKDVPYFDTFEEPELTTES